MPIKNHPYLSAIPKLATSFPDESFDTHKNDYASLSTSNDKLNIDGTFLKYEQLMTMELPLRRLLLPWLSEGSLVMVAAERGIDKTHFALSLAVAVSEGTSFMRWPVVQAAGVLYVDEEIALIDIRDRLKIFAPDLSCKSLSILSNEWFYKYFKRDLKITDPDIQAALLKHLAVDKQLRVLILNNISLPSSVREDNGDDWYECMLPFFIRCRRIGVAVILLYQCGQSRKHRRPGSENHLDTSIMLTRTKNNMLAPGYCFQLSFTKARSSCDDTMTPFIATLQTSALAATWKISTFEKKSTKDKRINYVRTKNDEEINVTDAADD